MYKGLIGVGKVIRPHGLFGEMSIIFSADELELLDRIKKIFFAHAEQKKATGMYLTSWRCHQQNVLITVDAIDSREAVRFWQGAEVFIRQKNLPRGKENNIFLFEIKDISVFSQDGTLLGIVESAQDYPAQEMWQIRTPDGEIVLFPAVPEWILDFDLTTKKAIINPPEGLFELCKSKK